VFTLRRMVATNRCARGRTHNLLAMEKVVGSSPIIRSTKAPGSGGFLFLSDAHRRVWDRDKVEAWGKWLPLKTGRTPKRSG
jgi:hypothetical protein